MSQIKTKIYKNNKHGVVELAKVIARKMAEQDYQAKDKAA